MSNPLAKTDVIEQYAPFMRRAITLACKGRGFAEPNPLVGAVVVRDGQIVGEGYHHAVGMPHAEVEALHDAGEAARGATMIVTLEPCTHHGRTPPCVDALIDAGVAEVIFAGADPNPLVCGLSQSRLEAAGIRVIADVLREEAEAINRPFFKHMRSKTPFVTAKIAITLDGKIATRTGESQWITNAAARQTGHRLRHESGAIVIGVDTLIADDPRLTVRHPEIYTPSHPTRIVVDSRGRSPLSSKMFDVALPGKTIVATTAQMPAATEAALREKGVGVWRLPAGSQNRVNLSALFQEAGRHDIQSIMVEGGGTLLGSLIEGQLIDRFWVFIAPMMVGGADAPGPFQGAGVATLTEALRLENIELSQLDDNIWIVGDVVRPKEEES